MTHTQRITVELNGLGILGGSRQLRLIISLYENLKVFAWEDNVIESNDGVSLALDIRIALFKWDVEGESHVIEGGFEVEFVPSENGVFLALKCELSRRVDVVDVSELGITHSFNLVDFVVDSVFHSCFTAVASVALKLDIHPS